MSLIDLVQQENQEARDKALGVYRETLQRDADPKPGDAKRLQAAMATLGYGPDRLAADLAVLRRAESLTADAAANTSELIEQLDQAWAALTAHIAGSERIAADRETERVKLHIAADRLTNRQTVARDAAGKLKTLQGEHRDLFGLPALEPEAAPVFSQTYNVMPSPSQPASPLIETDFSLLPK